MRSVLLYTWGAVNSRITRNGVRVQGRIQAFDNYVVVILSKSGILNMLYKHAISTIITENN
ncbi:hypothetical protein PPYC1_24465 [Paenibacillus polymyxa]|uniref:RNA chaperone Hfq n=1 Tax=Paenibacillus TaxID=44249 RepID=UPI0009BEBD0A|nr:hypothetical protein PPYC1_24465 [Paenibacillus polymyxa]